MLYCVYKRLMVNAKRLWMRNGLESFLFYKQAVFEEYKQYGRQI